MRRRHTREDFLGLVDQLRRAVPDISLSTDIIVGFPGETDADFSETLSLTRAVGFSSMFSFKYSERPNTLASKRLKDDVREEEKGRRLTELQDVQRAIQWDLNRAAVGREFEVLIDSRSRRRTHELAGRTTGNVVVNLPGQPAWLGQTVRVTILRAGPHSLWGEAIDAGPVDMAALDTYVVRSGDSETGDS
jgi:tRNA-2-methylthio-N6-dimethylallyladenosine synthase